MALRKIVEMGEDCLTKVCRPVTDFNRRLHILLDDMTETLAEANGAGLAAPQVGVLRRACVVLDMDSEEYIELINPEIISQSGEQTGLEGCLSVPGRRGPDGPVLLPRAGAFGRPPVYRAHRPIPHGRGSGGNHEPGG